MTQREQLLELFHSHGNRLTLGEILQSPVGYEWRARATELRREAYRIELAERGKKPSGNVYILTPPPIFDGAQAVMFLWGNECS